MEDPIKKGQKRKMGLRLRTTDKLMAKPLSQKSFSVDFYQSLQYKLGTKSHFRTIDPLPYRDSGGNWPD